MCLVGCTASTDCSQSFQKPRNRSNPFVEAEKASGWALQTMYVSLLFTLGLLELNRLQCSLPAFHSDASNSGMMLYLFVH